MLENLVVQNSFEEGFFFFFCAFVFVFDWLTAVQNHTMELCEVTDGSPETGGII